MDNMLKTGDIVTIIKGCVARGLFKGGPYIVADVSELGADYSHSVRVTLQQGNRRVNMYARHRNRLSDPVINLNDGNPLHKIKIQKRR